MKNPLFIFPYIFFLLVSCSSPMQIGIDPALSIGNQNESPLPTIPLSYTRVPPASAADRPYLNATAEITRTPNESDNAIINKVDNVNKTHVPILLFHHISESIDSRYSLTPADFSELLRWLSDTGYRTISMQALHDAITGKSQIPENAIIITFDDGNKNVYKNAFPIMKEMGFSGVTCVVANRIGAEGFLSADELKVLNESGWDICNHSMTHFDLNIDHERVRYEMGDSRKRIQMLTGLDVDWFAYPFGKADKTVLDWARRLGYAGAFGLGTTSNHSLESLFYLSRIEINSDTTFTQLAGMLN